MVPGMFNTGHPEKKFDTFKPSSVAEVMRTFKSEARCLINLFIKPKRISLQQKRIKNKPLQTGLQPTPNYKKKH
jgi:hypothetical protein